MASIADLTVNLALQTASFEASAKATRQTLKNLTGGFKEVKDSLDVIKRGFETVGIALGLRELVNFGLETLKTAGDLNNLAQQLGVGAGALQAYQYAARQSGVSAQQLEDGLSHLTRTIGDAAAGNKAAIDAFAALGVGVLDAQGNIRSTDDVLSDVAESLSKIQDPARRASAEVDLFGRAGQRLDPILAQGAAGLRALRGEAEQTGHVLSGEMLKAAQDANDSITKLQGSFGDLVQYLLVVASPALSRISDEIRIALGGATLNEKLAKLNEQLATAQQLGARAGVSTGAIQDQIRALELQKDILNEPSAVAGAPAGIHNPAAAGGRSGAGGKAAAAEIRDETSALQEYIAGLQQERTELGLTATQRETYTALIAASAAAQKDYDAGLRSSPLLTGEEAAAIRQQVTDLGQTKDRLDMLRETSTTAFGDMKTAALDVSSAVENIGTAFLDSVTGIATWQQFALAAARSVFNELLKFLTAAPSGGGSSIIGSLFSAVIGGFGFGGGGLANAPGGMASGGRPPIGQATLVGEKGPEWFVPDQPGTVLPHGFTPGGDGGGTAIVIHNAYDFRGSSVSQADVERSVEAGNRKTYSAVFAAMSRGGPEAKASGRRNHK